MTMGAELDDVRDHLCEFVDRTEHHHERVMSTPGMVFPSSC